MASHGIRDQVAIVGVPDPVLGEIGVAFVVRAAGSTSDEADLLACEQAGMMLRHTVQFHWHNANYQDFEDFLSRFFLLSFLIMY